VPKCILATRTFSLGKCSASHFSKENVRTCSFLFCKAKNTKKKDAQHFPLQKEIFTLKKKEVKMLFGSASCKKHFFFQLIFSQNKLTYLT
jgi:hypothetical protein